MATPLPASSGVSDARNVVKQCRVFGAIPFQIGVFDQKLFFLPHRKEQLPPQSFAHQRNGMFVVINGNLVRTRFLWFPHSIF